MDQTNDQQKRGKSVVEYAILIVAVISALGFWLVSVIIQHGWIVAKIPNSWCLAGNLSKGSLSLLAIEEYNFGPNATLELIDKDGPWQLLPFFGEFDYFYDTDAYGIQMPTLWVSLAIILLAWGIFTLRRQHCH